MADPMTPERLAEIRARARAATLGPWVQDQDADGDESGITGWLPSRDIKAVYTTPDGDTDVDFLMSAADANDAAFIAASRTDVPDLLGLVDRQHARIIELTQEGADLRAMLGRDGKDSGRMWHDRAQRIKREMGARVAELEREQARIDTAFEKASTIAESDHPDATRRAWELIAGALAGPGQAEAGCPCTGQGCLCQGCLSGHCELCETSHGGRPDAAQPATDGERHG